MATIDIKKTEALLIVSVTGTLSVDDAITFIHEHYPSGAKNVIWDLTKGSLAAISLNGFREIATAAKESCAHGVRGEGKTAYVGATDVDFGLLRMYSAFEEIAGIQIEYHVFRTMVEAYDWLKMA
jgi:hypothetical protein